MAATTINIRLDTELKRQMEEVASSIGLTVTAAFNVFARQFVAHRGFPFAVVEPEVSEREFAQLMDDIYSSMHEGNASEHDLLSDE